MKDIRKSDSAQTLQLRVRPLRSLLDINIPQIKQTFEHIEGVCTVEVIDNRRGDAFFVTVLVALQEPITAVTALKKAVHSFTKLKLFLVDSHGNELALNSTNVKDVLKYIK